MHACIEQKRRVLDAEDAIWSKLKDKPIKTMEIKEKTPYDGKHVFLIQCPICYNEIPQKEYPIHINSHKENPVKNMFEAIKGYRGK